jgi:hypothetical protein
MQATTPSDRRYAGEGPAQALRAHGGRFPAIVDALRDAPRTAILPPLRSAPRSAAIRTPASAAPPGAHRLAQAPQDARRRRQLHPKTLQHGVPSDLHALASAAAVLGRSAAVTQTLRNREACERPATMDGAAHTDRRQP